jgi:serine/threonine-protein kinase RsbW
VISLLKDICPRQGVHSGDEAIDWHTRKLHLSEEIVPTIDDLIRLLESAGYFGKELFAIRLALEEALVNAIKHGHKGDASKEVQLRYYLASACLLVEVEDQGAGFQPQEVPDPFAAENLERSSGRGLLLMRNYMTWVRYNERGNRVTMCRQHSGA